MSKLRADNACIAAVVAAWSVVVIGPRRSKAAPLTELNAEWCRSEGVGSMWVGSLRT